MVSLGLTSPEAPPCCHEICTTLPLFLTTHQLIGVAKSWGGGAGQALRTIHAAVLLLLVAHGQAEMVPKLRTGSGGFTGGLGTSSLYQWEVKNGGTAEEGL